MVDYSKLKTNLNLILHRLKLVEKKKIELNHKARKQIGDFLNTGKVDRARIRVEQIIREDYQIEAMDIIESYCDLILSRFGQLQSSNAIDEGLKTAISSIIWITPRLESDLSELKVISDQLGQKYGKPYIMACRENQLNTVNEVLIKKMNVQAPAKVLVERYLIEIAKDQKIDYKPDKNVLKQQEAQNNTFVRTSDDDDDNDAHDGRPPGGGFNLIDLGDHYPAAPITQPFSPYGHPPPLPSDPPQTGDGTPRAGPSAPHANLPIGFNLDSNMGGNGGGSSRPPPTMINKPGTSAPSSPSRNRGPNANAGSSSLSGGPNSANNEAPPPNYDSIISGIANTSKLGPRGGATGGPSFNSRNVSRMNISSQNPSNLDDTLPELPPVPSATPDLSNLSFNKDKDDGMDFEDLTRRFEELKNKK